MPRIPTSFMAIGIISMIALSGCTNANQANLDAFSQCIAAKKLTMYGAAWCSHCKREKANFGSSFQYIPYVECPENTQLCLDKGVDGYPTWIDADGKKYV